MNIVNIQNLRVCYDSLEVLKGVNLTVKEGEVVALIGRSGCGKSTLLRVISGIVPGMIPALVEGNVEVLGMSPQRVPRGRLDMVFQEGNLLPWRNVHDNVQLGAELAGKNALVACDAIGFLKRVGLNDFRSSYPRQLSGGMKQRVAVVASMINCPDLLLMDEPFGSLDAMTREEMWLFLEELEAAKSNRSSIVLVTHSVPEAVVLADWILIMDSKPGRIAEEVVVNIPRPRIQGGTMLHECFELSEQVGNKIRRLSK